MIRKEEVIRKLVKEELKSLNEGMERESPKIEEKLETLRKKLVKEGGMMVAPRLGDNVSNSYQPVKHIDIKSVSEVIDVPINSLMLFCINKLKNEDYRPIQYHLGHLYFSPSQEDTK